ncbi:Qat anti-phage system TatD family nuclease QatD [Devosia sp.]|uniref:Qat anti-phage system TatD family nuclease QatD n=1 Tax=Devosia sp. TaxID=1871048 RepID=UPI00292DF424|nr:Qat anti-phage system TatD family nuclease QatD [Devosia sp.]
MGETISKLVDFHCHLDLYPDFEKLVSECDRRGVYTLAVTTTPMAWQRNNELAGRTTHVRAALGLHPQLVAKYAGEIELFEKLLPEAKYVGEVGLDASPAYYASFEQQRAVFERVLRACAAQGGKILSVHSVRSASKVLDMVEQFLPADRGTVILHWFSGSKSEARRAAALGCWFSVNAPMLRNERMMEIIRSEMPGERIITETDGPFTKAGKEPSRPSDVGEAVRLLGVLLGREQVQQQAIVLSNLRRLLESSPTASFLLRFT